MKKTLLLGAVAFFATSTLIAADGAALYKKCIACHGEKAEKVSLGKGEVIQGWPVDKLVTSLQGYKAGTLNAHGMGALMKGQVGTYSDADIQAVSEYISTLK